MNEAQTEIIKNTVYKFAELSNISDKSLCDDLINQLTKMDVNDSIDTILVALNSLLNRGVLKQEDIFTNSDLLTSLNPDKYKSVDDLIDRLNWIKSMNMEYSKMTLRENHKLVIEAFDEFNKLIGDKFDCFYTGGLMGYLATNHKLERYHGDLDLFINEEQLEALYELVSKSKDFEFISNMDKKEVNGHEYKVTYKGTPMSIGLFLFERTPNEEVVIKEYYYDNKNPKDGLYVDEQHLSKEYADMMFSNQIREHNGTIYKMQSLESIYNSKKNSRPKDIYDANIIKDSVDMQIDSLLDTHKQSSYEIKHKPAQKSIVEKMEKRMKQPIVGSEDWIR